MNILFFLTDDHGQWASSPYWGEGLVTPALQWLADHGTTFDRAYTPCPVCSPARSTVFTGCYPSTHGIHDYLQEHEDRTPTQTIEGQRTLPQFLRENGYTTALCGKWHCGGAGHPQPGWDTWFSSLTGTTARPGPQRFSDHGHEVCWDGQQAPVITDRALRFLRERDSSKPFFLTVGYTDTHSPFAGAPARWYEHYKKVVSDEFPVPLQQPDNPAYSGRSSSANKRSREQHIEINRQYCATVSYIDEQIGRILDFLDDARLTEETLIIYSSDHGHMNGFHGYTCKGNATIPANFFEESIRVPLILRWPGKPGGRRSEAFCHHGDLLATLLDVAGGENLLTRAGLRSGPLPESGDPNTRDPALEGWKERAAGSDDGRARPGLSLRPLLNGPAPDGWRQTVVCEYGNSRMASDGRIKRLKRYPGPNGHPSDETYNLQTDPGETNPEGVNPSEPAVTALDAHLESFFEAFGTGEHSGISVGERPPFNSREPWRSEAPPR